MSLPDFTKIAFSTSPAPAQAPSFVATPEGIPVASRHNAGDIAGLPHQGTYPGLAPFLRGPYPTMYVQKPWTIRQYAGFSTAEDLSLIHI